MKRVPKIMTVAALAVLCPTLTAFAGDGQKKVRGEVVQVQQMQQTRNQGEADQITVRTRQGEEMRLRLGQAGPCPDCVQVGDQIRARVMAGADGQPWQVQSMKVRRNGEMYAYQNQAGQMVQSRQRLRDGTGGGQQVRERARSHDPGSTDGRGGAGSGGRGKGRGGGGKR